MIASRATSDAHETRIGLRNGVSRAALVAGVTLGPRGGVGLRRPWGGSMARGTGLEVAAPAAPEGPLERLGFRFALETARQVERRTGDGTATTLVLLAELFHEVVRWITSGADPIEVRDSLRFAADEVDRRLARGAEPLDGAHGITDLATSACAGDRRLGEAVATAVRRAGSCDGVQVARADTPNDYLEGRVGHLFGGIAPHGGSVSGLSSGNWTVESPMVVVASGDLDPAGARQLVRSVGTDVQPILLIAPEQRLSGIDRSQAFRERPLIPLTTSRGEGAADLLEDLATVTSGRPLLFRGERGGGGAPANPWIRAGAARRAHLTKRGLVIEPNAASGTQIEANRAALQRELEDHADPDALLGRLFRLAPTSVTVRLADAPESEYSRRRDLAVRALRAVRGASEAGVLPGGGAALFHAASEAGSPEGQGGVLRATRCVAAAAGAVIRRLAENAGFDGRGVLEEVQAAGPPAHGFDVSTQQVRDLRGAGVLDAANVVRWSLRAAVATAELLLLTETVVGRGADARLGEGLES
ncbi:MAG: TCP-1/cpn60 chaperonin family protein [Gemmatimonadota bacterium]